MRYFNAGIKIPEYFGDFGGRLITDTDNLINSGKAAEFEEALCSVRFDKLFERNLKIVLPITMTIEKYNLSEDRTLFVAPGLSRYYNLAGQLALAEILEKKEINAGLYSGNMAIALATSCKELGFSCSLVLSQSLSKNESLVAELKGLGCTVDVNTCASLVDIPHALFEKAFFNPTHNYVFTAEANFGVYPKPGLTGLMCGLYGKALHEHMQEKVDCCVVPIVTGTEAIGVFHGLISSGCTLATVEEPVCQEFHIADSGAYTISTKSASEEKMNTTICPELANWWRTGMVTRLGADTLSAVSSAYLVGTTLSQNATRAAALAFERTGCKKLLVIGGEDR